MKAIASILISALLLASCGIFDRNDRTVAVAKPRLHKTWPKKHKWHKKLRVWKYTVQMPERGGVKTVRMKN